MADWEAARLTIEFNASHSSGSDERTVIKLRIEFLRVTLGVFSVCENQCESIGVHAVAKASFAEGETSTGTK